MPTPKSTRRSFIKRTTAGMAATALPLPQALFAGPETQANHALPPHRALTLPGCHAYADRQSVAAGETIRFHVSNSIPCEFSIVRLGPRVDDPAIDVVLHTFPPAPARPQPIHPGSYVRVEKSLAPSPPLAALTCECWVRLFSIDTLQALIAQHDSSRGGFGLFIGPGGETRLILTSPGTNRDEAILTGPRLKRLQWFHLVATWDGKKAGLWINAERVAETAFAGPLDLDRGPLRLGASGVAGQTDRFLDGDLSMPVLYDRALAPEEITRRCTEKGLGPPAGREVLGCWPLSEERGDRVADVSSHRRHGRIFNHATWMIGGPGFEAAKVPRYGGAYDPAQDPARGHGLRFAADDLYDCRWLPTHKFRVPRHAKSGIYCARARFELGGKPMVYHVTFIVRRPRSRAKAPLLVLCSSNTWLAYSASPFAENQPLGRSWGTEGFKSSHPRAPAYSCYLNHLAGQPTYQQGLRMPWPVAAPDVMYSSKATGYSHLMRGERFAHAWLDENGYDYDVITDLDLHRDPGQLQGYRALLINGHSEYWSIEAYEGVDRFLRAGGSAMVFSGNTMFWRVTFSEDGSVMECRKFDDRIGGRKNAPIGELFHSHDRRRGSLMRECGYPAWRVVGLECAGWGGVETKELGVYHTELPGHFLFNQPEKIGLARNETFGHAPDGGAPRAIGHEWDVRLQSLLKSTKNPPPGATLPEEPPGIVTLARSQRENKAGTLDYFTAPAPASDGVCAEMIYWERPQGGRVFHAGAIGAGWALSADPKLQALTRNVLHHFGVHPAPRQAKAR